MSERMTHARNRRERREPVELMKYIKIMREFREREGYYPEFGKPHQREEDPEPRQPTRPPFIPRRRWRPWK